MAEEKIPLRSPKQFYYAPDGTPQTLDTGEFVSAFGTFEDNNGITLFTAEISKYPDHSDEIAEMVIESEDEGNGLTRVTFNVDSITNGTAFMWDEAFLPLLTTDMRMKAELLASAPFYVVNDGTPLRDATLFTSDTSALFMSDITSEDGEPVRWRVDTLTLEASADGGETWGSVEESPTLYAFTDTEGGNLIRVRDVIEGLNVLWATVGAASYLYEQKYKKERTAGLPRQDVSKLRTQSDPNSKVAYAMTNPNLFLTDGALLDVRGDGEKKQGKDVDTAVTFSWDGEGIEIYRPISQYDREVHGAVSSLWADGQRNITPSQIARAMGIKNPTERQAAAAAESVDLQRRVLGKIDFSEEARGRSLMLEGEPVTDCTLEGYLIAADKTKLVSANGRVVEGYVLHRPPLIYQHASALRQVVSYPQRLLELGEGKDSEKKLLLRRELMRRVRRIKHEYGKAKTKKQRDSVNRHIRFTAARNHPERKSLFDIAGVNQRNRAEKKRATDYVLEYLGKLVDDGEISDYKPLKESGRGGTRVIGVEIIL